MYTWLNFGRRDLMLKLLKDPDKKIALPTDADVRKYQEAIGAKYPEGSEVWATTDRLELWVLKSGKYCIQNMFYKG